MLWIFRTKAREKKTATSLNPYQMCDIRSGGVLNEVLPSRVDEKV